MSADSQHQYIVFLQQFLKGGFYTVKNWAPPTSDTTRSSKRRFLHSQKGKFLFRSPPCIYAYYSNSSVYIFHCLSKERFLHRKNRRISTQCALSPPLYPIRVLGCTMINKREVSTPEKPAIVISTYVCRNSFENRDSSMAKKRFPHAYFGWFGCSNLFLQPFKPLASGVETSFAKCFFLLAGMWKPLFLHIIINK